MLLTFIKSKTKTLSEWTNHYNAVLHSHRTYSVVPEVLKLLQIHFKMLNSNSNLSFWWFFFTLFYSYMADEVLFLAQIFEVVILIDLHNLTSPNPKITLLAVGLCVRVCVSVISITQKLTVVETSIFIFCISIMYRC